MTNVISKLKKVDYMEVLLVIGIFITSIVCIMFLSSNDCRIIAEWSRLFYKCFKEGIVDQFATISYTQLGLEANYSLLFYIISTICYIPIAIIESITAQPVDIIEIMVYFKFLMLICFVFIAKGLVEICRINNRDKYESFFLIAAFFLSPAIQITQMGHGQVDVIGLIFMVYAYRAYLQDKSFEMYVYIGICLLFKPFSIFLFVPLIIYNIINSPFLQWLKGVFIVFALYIIQWGLEYLYLGTYFELRKQSDYGFLWKYFVYDWVNVPVYVTLVCIVLGIQFVLCVRRIVNKKHIIIFSGVLYVLMYAMTEWNVQYISYGFITFIILCSHYYNHIIDIMAYTVFNLFFSVAMVLDTTGSMHTLTIESLAGRSFGGVQTYIGEYLLINKMYYWPLKQFIYAGIIASFVVLIVDAFVKIRFVKKEEKKELSIYHKNLVRMVGLFQVLFVILFLVIVYGAQKIYIPQ